MLRVLSLICYSQLQSSIMLCLTAPTGYPLNLRISEVTNTSAIATWEPVEQSKRNSEISGYILQYNDTVTKVTHSKSVNSPTTFRIKLRYIFEQCLKYYF